MDRPSMSTKTAAEYLGVSLRTVQRLIHRGEIPIVQVGRRILVRKVSLDEFLQVNEHRRAMSEGQG